jgi:hypothetical protein
MRKCRLLLSGLALVVSGCPSHENQQTDVSPVRSALVVQVEKLIVTGQELRLTYWVDNSSSHEVWVCEDMEAHIRDHSVQSAATRVIDDSLWIELGYRRPPGQDWRWSTMHYARYHRVRPGESSSGMIILTLPVRDASPIYRYSGSSHAVVTRRVVLEIGFLTANLPAILCEEEKNIRVYAFGDDMPAPDKPLLPRSNDPDIAFVPYGMDVLETEQTAQAVCDGVNVPCVAVVRTR